MTNPCELCHSEPRQVGRLCAACHDMLHRLYAMLVKNPVLRASLYQQAASLRQPQPKAAVAHASDDYVWRV